ncbi:DUF3953 domain-containing protein [Bacillus sp. FJAT-45037]|uniref:DUF3953 domain-containing protein n=1 Tax=Bacillus sp. FJAT-45037 TaxID=2011007 RepID=UPI000C231CCD|nr:DUF3953 domain-containing protein [Bacillus sp. FJAT-45037]
MLKVLRVILSIFVFTLGGFALITQNFDLLPYSLILLGILTFILGLIELKKDQKSFWGYANIGASVFVIFVAIYTSIFN